MRRHGLARKLVRPGRTTSGKGPRQGTARPTGPNFSIMAKRRGMKPPVKAGTVDRAPLTRPSLPAADQGLDDGYPRGGRGVREHATADGARGTVQP